VEDESTIPFVTEFGKVDVSDFPDFYIYKTPLERGLWILWVAKEKLGKGKLTAKQISSIIVNVKEINADSKSIAQAFKKARDRIRATTVGDETYYEIMKPGKDYLLSNVRKGSVALFYFEPGKPFTSKKVLSKDILNNLRGELRIVDPYCNERTLDILKDIKDRNVKFLTKIENLKDEQRFLRELRDFRSENESVEFRTYPHKDIHDRYIISSDFLAILGHSIKDLGSKESLAILLKRSVSKNIVEALIENFDRRWKQSESI